MKTQAKTGLRELNQLHQSMYETVFDYVWIPAKVLTKKKFKSTDQIDSHFCDYEDYCGVREIDGTYQVYFPIYKLDYLVGLDVVIEHGIFDDDRSAYEC
jgi:hypothetical protein